ncbi:MAG TPA: TetR/AcrR family transcriptional regulator [Pseudonocardiaceae bacterium]|nr:TetR/AcrR family transcriptional regulator [Pseudonocardiaceae bacterium]
MSARGQAPVRGRGEPRRPLRRDARANQDRVLAAAVTAVLREGRQVPMATIAAEAGVGVATLYRRYPNREALLDALTHRAFELLLELARAAESREDTALACLSWWWDRVIDQRDQLVLPLGGGPPVTSAQTLAVQSQLHNSLQRLLERGQRECSIRDDITTRDVVIFGAMLVAPLPGAGDWDRTARRQKEIYLDGLSPPATPIEKPRL